jgi:hypothetical protein
MFIPAKKGDTPCQHSYACESAIGLIRKTSEKPQAKLLMILGSQGIMK